MKYQNLKSFQKHLANAAPHHLCRFYLVAIADDYERAKTLDAILKLIATPPTHFSGADCSLRDLLDALQTMTLFGDSPVVVLDEAEKLAKKDLLTLRDSLSGYPGYFLLGARAKTIMTELIEKEGVILDLLEEKPWDKEKRLAEQLIEKAKAAGKKLMPDGAMLLFERLGADAALLDSELNKLICYVGERPVISREDILLLSPASKTATLWQSAEEVIWEKGAFPSLDVASFHALLPALRSQLHLGLTLATLIEEKCPSDQWNQFLPKLWPKTLEKRSSQAARLGSSFFRKGLEKLFEVECLSRTNSTQYRALLDLFQANLR